ncbi:MAG: hypothetical protein M1814_006875 [Vezdaea aestivalis]|nr:MAG: hypothetical protein M1814_006875 [Vezdaea aestivalis]
MANSPSYIDYETFLDPSFSPQTFANALLLQTNNPSDTPLDLSTPLSRALFDVQEIDTHIHTLTTQSASALLSHTQQTTTAGSKIAESLSTQLESLSATYTRLEREVVARHAAAKQSQLAASRLWETHRLGRAVARVVALARQLELHMTEVGGGGGRREDHRALVRAGEVIVTLRGFLDGGGPETKGLEGVRVVGSVRADVIKPAELRVETRALQIVREFSIAGSTGTATASFAKAEDAKARTCSALSALYLLSPSTSEAALLTSSLQAYLTAQLHSSTSALLRALQNLPTFPRTLLEISTRSLTLLSLQSLLATLPPPAHPLLQSRHTSLLEPLLLALDTRNLASYFWRALAGALDGRVREYVGKGGPGVRGLRLARERVRVELRGAVERGMGGGEGKKGVGGEGEGCEREIAVMVGAVAGALGR